MKITLRRAAPLFLPLLLAACLSPREQCIANVSRDLGTLRSLIAQTEGNISRGYAYETRTVARPVFTTCTTRGGKEYRCWDEIVEQRRVAKAIDLDAERAKLRSMRAKERELARAAAPRIEACRAQYPAS